jgi:hypothetical protein
MDTVAAMTAVEFEEYWDSEPDDEVAKAKALASAVARAAGLHPSKAHQTASERPLAFPADSRIRCQNASGGGPVDSYAYRHSGDVAPWGSTAAVSGKTLYLAVLEGTTPYTWGSSAPKVASAARSYQFPLC